jgi:heptosyltransferase-2
MTSPGESPKILIFRLSALGDVILCSAALSALRRVRQDAEVHWVISTTWAAILEQDNRIQRLISFDRRAGLLAWHRLCRQLFEERYDEVLDLHSSIRTRYARLYFLIRGLWSDRVPRRWVLLSKSRVRRWGFYLLKSAWPRWARPDHQGGLAVCAATLAGGTAQDRPDLSCLLSGVPSSRVREWIHSLSGDARGFLTVMPSSAWPGKRWSIDRIAQVLRELSLPVAILGTERDRDCWELSRCLEGSGLIYARAFEGASFSDTAHLIHASRLLLSNDTGLVHLAESIGKPVVQIFGPTDPALGFGVWRPESRVVASSLWCRPCSKDGSACFRWGSARHLCLQQISGSQVIESVREVMEASNSSGLKLHEDAGASS